MKELAVISDSRTDPDTAITRVEFLRRAAAKLLPPEITVHGWNVADLDYQEQADGEARWSVRLLGPVEAWTEEKRTLGGPAFTLLMVSSATCGRITARTADDLLSLIEQWIVAIGLEALRAAR